MIDVRESAHMGVFKGRIANNMQNGGLGCSPIPARPQSRDSKAFSRAVEAAGLGQSDHHGQSSSQVHLMNSHHSVSPMRKTQGQAGGSFKNAM